MKQTYYFLGLEDEHMVALAQILNDMEYQVVGWDYLLSMSMRKLLEGKGIKVETFRLDEIKHGDSIIVLEAYEQRAKELLSPLNKEVKWYNYHEFMSQWIPLYTSISIAGLQGKKTLARLMLQVLESFVPISYLLSESLAKGSKNCTYFIFEGCEEPKYIEAYQPDYLVITSMDGSQNSLFENKQAIKQTYLQMVKQVKKRVVACGDDTNTHVLLTAGPVLFYGFGLNNDLIAKNVVEAEGRLFFDVYLDKQFLDRFELGWCDKQAVLHVLAMIGIALLEGLDLVKLKGSIRSFSTIHV
ncbi:hypothetical protein [Thermoflavimicrobium dichotomicum]|uniref:UDP-N-acetylmuramate--alanine ligase n=1 Tax=Thermoflavimicrobium dichotomicum TaxID=46223 RepID=A0A1I3MMY0_9BACL|nr:hypothetical protein [Thermoflavimicrobium dichotomicum]SFI98026.1 UDP-N-acetylmuramate--alanine ligase [Thermoflavimicrobium dichotomicum]